MKNYLILLCLITISFHQAFSQITIANIGPLHNAALEDYYKNGYPLVTDLNYAVTFPKGDTILTNFANGYSVVFLPYKTSTQLSNHLDFAPISIYPRCDRPLIDSLVQVLKNTILLSYSNSLKVDTLVDILFSTDTFFCG